jgi:exoribonuclease R
VPTPVVRIKASSPDLLAGLDRIRADLGVPVGFPPEMHAAALVASRRPVSPRAQQVDMRDLDVETIDPLGSRDLDQAYFGERTASGFRVRYAIADVATFVASGDELDQEARRRGVTLYLPDQRALLYPASLSEGAASLLPDKERPALLWTIDLDDTGVATDWRLEAALVRSRRALTYQQVQRAIKEGTANDSLMVLREVGLRREEQERQRGGVSIAAVSQEVDRVGDSYELIYDATLPVEGWNAQVSLLAGVCAASTMIDGGVGIVRTLPPPDEGVLRRLRRVAGALDVDWPEGRTYPEVVRNLTPAEPKHAAFLMQALEALRGAGYALVEPKPAPPPMHSAIAAPYAHVTAPLRRLVDRFANEIVLALCAGTKPPPWCVDALPALPDLMHDADRRDKAVARAAVDLVECLVVRTHVGETFAGTVIDVNDDRATVQLSAPPVIATLDTDGLALGSRVEARLVAVHLEERRVEFAVA